MAEALKTVVDFVAAVFWWIYMFILFIIKSIGNLFKKIYIPLLPSATRVLQESFVSGSILALFVLYVVIMNISAFNLFRKDKIIAASMHEMSEDDEKRYERISERRLLRRCFFGGAIGGYLAMKALRHKTLKRKFTIGVTFMLVVQLLLNSVVIGYFSFWLYLA